MFVEKFTNIAKSKKATAVTALFSATAIFAEADHSYNHSRLSDSLSGVARFIMDHGSSLYPFISVSALGLAEFAIKNRTFRKYVPFLALYSTIAFTGSFLI